MAHLETFKDGRLWVDKDSFDQQQAELTTLQQAVRALPKVTGPLRFNPPFTLQCVYDDGEVVDMTEAIKHLLDIRKAME